MREIETSVSEQSILLISEKKDQIFMNERLIFSTLSFGFGVLVRPSNSKMTPSSPSLRLPGGLKIHHTISKDKHEISSSSKPAHEARAHPRSPAELTPK
jgi:hypothetical protein